MRLPETNKDLLTPDCENCQALCCLALALDRGPSFAIDKPAGLPCPNLQTNHRCKIHTGLEAAGFSGCVAYSCQGAGQWVSGLYRQKSWRRDPEYARAMIADFAIARELRAALELLLAAAHLSLSAPQKAERAALISALTPEPTDSRQTFDAWNSALKPRHLAFLESLRRAVSH